MHQFITMYKKIWPISGNLCLGQQRIRSVSCDTGDIFIEGPDNNRAAKNRAAIYVSCLLCIFIQDQGCMQEF